MKLTMLFLNLELLSLIAFNKAHGKNKNTLHVVKDMGAYLMADVQPTKDMIEKELHIRYAHRKRPEHGHIGGDDFVEKLKISDFEQHLSKGYNLQLVFTENEFSVSLVSPMKPKPNQTIGRAPGD